MNITGVKIRLCALLLICVVAACKTQKKAEAPVAEVCAEVSYEKEVKGILLKTCTECHGRKDPQSFVSFANINELVMNGELHKQVIKKKKMPPNTPLTNAEYKAIKCWLEQGAKNN